MRTYVLDIDPLLPVRYPTLKDVLRKSVYGCSRPISEVAKHCGVSPSLLSRMLSESDSDPRHLPVDLLPLIVEATGDRDPFHWLSAKFLLCDRDRQRSALANLESVIPHLSDALMALQRSVR